MTTRDYVPSRWGQIHYRRSSPGSQLALLLHESPLSSEVFEPLLRAADGRIEFVAPDTPGYGMSDPPLESVPLEEYAATLWEAVRPLWGESLAWLVGTHTGACLAIEIARNFPGDVAGVVLSGTPIFGEDRRWKYVSGHTPDLTPQRDGSHLMAAWERYRRKAAEGTSPQDLAFITWAACTVAANWRGFDAAYQAAFRYDTLSAFAELSVPIYLLTAENDACAAFDDTLVEFPQVKERVVLPHVSGRPYWVAPDLFRDDLTTVIESASQVEAWAET